ncbi:hypothetical protein [Thalassobacillus sp. CUG 92003]|uniref:hypothetical protein n=1 Tax=Thalassobacillus sp. CUG 92003 TaxID=2736641 RepID=UPI0015E64751|nr:hypothetical protein [Thalassobacillus sp. CUG 92003]
MNQKFLIAVIGVLVLVLAGTLMMDEKQTDPTEEENSEQEQPSGTVNAANEPPQIDPEAFKAYFSDVEPIEVEQTSTSINTDEVPEDDRKGVAATRILKAAKSLNVQGEMAIPDADSIDEFFTPNDEQLKDLMYNNRSLEATPARCCQKFGSTERC